MGSKVDWTESGWPVGSGCEKVSSENFRRQYPQRAA